MTKEDILAWVEKELDVMKTTVCPCRKLLGFKHGWCDVMTYQRGLRKNTLNFKKKINE